MNKLTKIITICVLTGTLVLTPISFTNAASVICNIGNANMKVNLNSNNSNASKSTTNKKSTAKKKTTKVKVTVKNTASKKATPAVKKTIASKTTTNKTTANKKTIACNNTITSNNTLTNKNTTSNNTITNKNTTTSNNILTNKNTTTSNNIITNKNTTTSNKTTTGNNTPTDKDTKTNSSNSVSSNYTEFQNQVVELVNKERTAVGLNALTADRQLNYIATLKSEDMANLNYFDHTSKTYGTPFEMLKQFGVSYTAAGENIAMGQKTPAEVMNGWMNSQGHRANILNSNFTKIGVGIAQNAKGQLYWTQTFIR